MKKIIRLTESDLRRIVKESVNKILEDGGYDNNGVYYSNASLDAMSKAFSNYVKGSNVLAKGVKVLRGNINPETTYFESMGVYKNTLMPGDVVIEYPDGRKHTLTKK